MTQKSIWTIDAGHSEIRFKVKHLAIANVSGSFKIFEGKSESDTDDFEHATIFFEIDARSIDTNNAERDGHLRSELFLHAEKFPKITFKGAVQKEEDDYTLAGDLTILETTRHITLQVEHTGMGKGRFDDLRAGFEVSGKINRKDFGLNFHLLNDAGNLVVGDDIKIQCDIELIKQKAAEVNR
jgi:polyisoprenoid-binding protein YceI